MIELHRHGSLGTRAYMEKLSIHLPFSDPRFYFFTATGGQTQILHHDTTPDRHGTRHISHGPPLRCLDCDPLVPTRVSVTTYRAPRRCWVFQTARYLYARTHWRSATLSTNVQSWVGQFVNKRNVATANNQILTIGFVTAATSNYILNRVWTFKSHEDNIPLEFFSFFTVSVIGLLINNLIIYFLTEKMNVKFYTAKLIAIGVVVIWNFFANYLVTFRS